MRTFENSGVLCKVDTTFFASASNNNLVCSAIEYYSVLREVIELQYLDNLTVVLFNCDKYNVLSLVNGMKVVE